MKNKFLLLTIAIVIKAAFAFYKVNELAGTNRIYKYTVAIEGGDTQSYLEPIENFIASGKYFDDYRMPGYGIVYFVLRIVFDSCTSMNLLLVLQVLLSGITVYFFAVITSRIIEQSWAFYTAYLCYLISTFVSIWDVFLLTESFCISALIISFYFLSSKQLSNAKLFLAGLFLTWAVFLKPVVAPVIAIISVLIFIRYRQEKLEGFKPVLYFLLPFILIDGVWVMRNYHEHHRFFFLTKSTYQKEIETTHYGNMIKFVSSFGGSVVHWDPGSEMSFFKKPVGEMKVKKDVVFPSYIFTSKFNMDSLSSLNVLIMQWNDSASALYKDVETDKRIAEKFDAYTASIKSEKPFLYHVKSRFILIKKFLIHSGTYNLFSKPAGDLNTVEFIIKAGYSILYLLILFCGFAGLIIMLFKCIRRFNFITASIALAAFYFTLIYPVVLRLTESRYFLPAYPFYVIGLCWLVFYLSNLKNKKPVT